MMRLIRPRFTIRWLMILVAIVAVSLTGIITAVRLKRRADYFRQRAAYFAASERFSRQMLGVEVWHLTVFARMRESNAREVRLSKHLSPELSKVRDERTSHLQNEHDELARSVEYYRDVAAHEARMKQKYDRAASRPWESVAPDPPPPTYPTRESTPPGDPDNPKPPGKRSIDNPILTDISAALCARARSLI
jgi:hypothetical protein